LAGFSVAKNAWDLSDANLYNSKPADIESESEEPARSPLKGSSPDRHLDGVAVDGRDHAVSVAEAMSPEEEAKTRKVNTYFHMSMMLASMYISMLLTNWGTEQAGAQYDVGWPSVWYARRNCRSGAARCGMCDFML
jgi:hypothetical protein